MKQILLCLAVFGMIIPGWTSEDYMKNKTMKTVKCDILIAGGGLGGTAAAIQACELAGKYGIKKVVVTEETDWPGGQYTSQAVTATDPNNICMQGHYELAASELYYKFHDTIRNYYRDQALKTAKTTARNGQGNTEARKREARWIKGNTFSPGNSWGSRMAFPPLDGVRAINEMWKPWLDSGLLEIHYQWIPVKVEKEGKKVTAVIFKDTVSGTLTRIEAKQVLDATELGDLLPLSKTDYRLGVDASEDTKEPTLFDKNGKAIFPKSLPGSPQSITFPFVVEWRAVGEDHRLLWETRPKSYDKWKKRFYLSPFMMSRYNEYLVSSTGSGHSPFWSYRRILDASILNASLPADIYPRYLNNKWVKKFDPDKNPEIFNPTELRTNVGDLLEVNWGSNDYWDKTIIDVSPEKRAEAIQEAKDLSLSFLYWLWYECPRDPDDSTLDPKNSKNWSIDPVTGKNRGYSNLKFRPDILGTADGLSKYPYIRESRRVKALFTILQQDIMGQTRARAARFPDTVGIGQYYCMDLHRTVPDPEYKTDLHFKETTYRDGTKGRENNTARFQIPYGALVPQKTDNLLMACKNLGVTHITNGTYRLHPVEFVIGQAAGAAAVLAIKNKCAPRDIWMKKQGDETLSGTRKLRELQHILLEAKSPLYWNMDCGWNTDLFEAVQWVCLLDVIAPEGEKFNPDAPLTGADANRALARFAELCGKTWKDKEPLSGDKVTVNAFMEKLSKLDPKLEWIPGKGALTRGEAAIAFHQSLLAKLKL